MGNIKDLFADPYDLEQKNLEIEKQRLEQNVLDAVKQDFQGASTQAAEMPTNDAAKAKRKALTDLYGEAGAEFVENFAEQQKLRRETNDERIRLLNEQNAKSADIRQKNFQHFMDYANELKQAAAVSQKEIEDQKNAAEKTSIFTGAGEFVNALANLGGTIAGANNQQPKTHAQNWQQEADKREQELRANRRANRETLARLTEQLNSLQTSNDLQALRDQTRVEDEKYRLSRLAQQEQSDARALMASFARQTQQNERAKEKNANSATNAAANATRAETGKQRETRLSGGAGSAKSDITLTLGATDTQPEETITVNKDALKTTILANINDIDDLSEQDKKEIQMLQYGTNNSTDLANKLLPYVKKSAKLRGYLRGATSAAPKTQQQASATQQQTSSQPAKASVSSDDPTGGAKAFFGIK